MIPPTCPGCDRQVSQFWGYACSRCAQRLPEDIKHDLRASQGRPATHRLDVETATEWLQAHPWRQPPKRTPLTPEQQHEVLAWLKNAQAVLDGTGEHAQHQREQVGRCVYCSCGARVQGRMAGAS